MFGSLINIIYISKRKEKTNAYRKTFLFGAVYGTRHKLFGQV